ncbi:hypothetical protein [Sphingobacterium athyrii]|nr:hypothetical protein [Sphingobacterium athyrii]
METDRPENNREIIANLREDQISDGTPETNDLSRPLEIKDKHHFKF